MNGEPRAALEAAVRPWPLAVADLQAIYLSS